MLLRRARGELRGEKEATLCGDVEEEEEEEPVESRRRWGGLKCGWLAAATLLAVSEESMDGEVE